MYLMELGLHLQQLYRLIQGFPVVQLEKNLPAMWETWAESLCWEDPLVKKKATYSSILAWRIPWTTQSIGSAESRSRLRDVHFSLLQTDPEIYKPR